MKFALNPVALAALFFVSGALVASPKQDPAGLAQALFPAPKAALSTPGAAKQTFTTYEQLTATLASLGQRPGVELYSLLKTAEGRDVWAVKLGNPQAKARVMFVARVHGDEPGASEGALQLLESLSGGDLKGQFGDLQIVVVPMANADGSHAHKRRTGAGGDINRDFIKYELAETRALQAEIQRFDPHVVVDAHEFTVWGRLGDRTIASDLMSTGPNEPNLPLALREVHDRVFRSAIDTSLSAAGLRHDLYELLSTDKNSAQLRVAESATTFVSAKNFHAMGGRISLLLEGRGIGLADQHMARRTLAQYLAMRAVVQSAQNNAAALAGLIEESRARIAALKTWELDRKPITQTRDFPLADSTSNTIVKVPAAFINRTEGSRGPVVEVPRYYLLPKSQAAVVEQLGRMGVEVKTLAKPLAATVGVQTAVIKADGKSLKVDSATADGVRNFAAGDFVIDTHQRAALYLQILEGASPNALVKAGLYGRDGGVELPAYRYNGSL